MKSKLFRRIGAYFLDLLIISLVSTTIASLIMNKTDAKLYDKYSAEYTTMYVGFLEGEMTEENLDILTNLSYNIEKTGITYTVCNAVFMIAYFGIYQFVNNGQTLGKKLFKLRVASTDNDNVSIIRFIFRTLINNKVIFTAINVILLFTLSQANYIKYSTYVSYLGTLVFYISAFMIIFTKENRGVHDYAAKTVVENV